MTLPLLSTLPRVPPPAVALHHRLCVHHEEAVAPLVHRSEWIFIVSVSVTRRLLLTTYPTLWALIRVVTAPSVTIRYTGTQSHAQDNSLQITAAAPILILQAGHQPQTSYTPVTPSGISSFTPLCPYAVSPFRHNGVAVRLICCTWHLD